MTRQYMNDKWCVRCGRKGPTPYLAKNIDTILKLLGTDTVNALDLGCGNGRNSEFIRTRANVVAVDMVADYGTPCLLGQRPLPLFPQSVDLVLANYVFMFLDADERRRVISDVRAAARRRCVAMVELYPAKDSWARDDVEVEALQRELFEALGWSKVRYSKGRFIALKEGE